MIPVLNRNATYKLNIPDMAGGVNFRDGLSLVNDNQMTDCKNMWYKDGMLKSRPRVLSNKNQENIINIGYPIDEKRYNYVHCNPANTTTIDGKEYVLEVFVETSNDFVNDWFFSAAFVHHFDKISVGFLSQQSTEKYFKNFGCTAIQHNGDIYFYTHWIKKIGDNETIESEIYKAEKLKDGQYGQILKAETYVPLVLTNGLPLIASENMVRGTQIEGFNLLSKDYIAQYSTFDYSTGKTENKMQFALLADINKAEYVGRTVTAVITDLEGVKHTHTATIDYNSESKTYAAREWQASTDNLEMVVEGNVLSFYDYDAGFEIAVEQQENYLKNNLEITAPCFTEAEYQEKLAKVTTMTQAVWYGNTSLGLNGGSRLFLGGSTKDTEKALVIWSDFENPLYFSENNYAYVGDKSQRVTAFGRQGSSLIIFKEREIYSTQYTQGTVSAEELENQQAIDITTHLATFPMVMIHSNIGCNCPDSIQLCRNRLVWADTNGKIYTMTTQNQYSERNVFEVGEMIERQLKKEELKNARSVDWEGKYILFTPESSNAYIMDYNSYGFVNVASYNKQSDANMLIPFFIWSLPFSPDEITQVVNNDGVLLVLTTQWLGNIGDVQRYVINHHILTEDINKDIMVTNEYTGKEEDGYNPNLWQVRTYEHPVESMFKTKLFDFGRADEYKNVYAVNIGLGFNGGVPVAITFESDARTSDKNTLKTGRMIADERTPVFFENKQILPYTRLCTKFGIKAECHGIMAVDSISLKYNIAGGKK